MNPKDKVHSYRLDKAGREHILEKIKVVISEKKEILFAFLYGSFVQDPIFRDIDIGIMLEGLAQADFWECECRISEDVKRAIDYRFPVDIRSINQAPLSFRFHVISGRLLFARNEDIVVDFLVYTSRKYLDMAVIRQGYLIEAMENSAFS